MRIRLADVSRTCVIPCIAERDGNTAGFPYLLLVYLLKKQHF